MSDRTRVLIVDDHPVVRAGLRAILTGQPDIEVAGEAASGTDAVARAADLRPDVVLMDLRLDATDGITATAAIRRLSPTPFVLVLTISAREADVVSAIEAGATGYLLKDAPPDRRPSREELSAREVEVLMLLAAGSSNKQIARRLHLSEATIKSHLVRIYSKLGVEDRTAAVTTALARSLLRLDAE